jgi:ATP-dependent Clp protease ATP-binding subunit ClpA
MESINKSLDYVANHKHPYVGIEHLLLVFTAPESDTAVTIHADLVGPCTKIREIVVNEIETGDGNGSRSVPQTPAAKQVILDSMKFAESLGHIGVNPEHMFLALLSLDSEPLVKQITENANIDVDQLRERLTTASELDKYTLPDPPDIDG